MDIVSIFMSACFVLLLAFSLILFVPVAVMTLWDRIRNKSRYPKSKNAGRYPKS